MDISGHVYRLMQSFKELSLNGGMEVKQEVWLDGLCVLNARCRVWGMRHHARLLCRELT